ncbi:MAG TPA: long-chain-acyl-CoA synthetase [Pseudomonadales bacterium]|nr:long-chain-acyl-CoA synthetase [Pseudomonadales bacterium]
MAGVREVFSTLIELVRLLRTRKYLAPRPLDTIDSIGARVEDLAVRLGDRTMLIFEGREITWNQFNALANRYANVLKGRGIAHGDVVSLMMENRIEFLAAFVAIGKLGAISSMINTNLRGRALTHCVSVTQSKAWVFGEELADAVAEVKADLSLREGNDYLFVADKGATAAPNWANDLGAEAAAADASNPEETRRIKLADSVTYIFTSGTTGLPKAAVVSQRRFLATGLTSCKAGFRSNENDRLYVCLPLYHGTGLIVGFGSTLYSGSTIFLRRKFSASNFLKEARQYRTNCFVYIGELCRYLMAQPELPDDGDNPIERIVGNGLRPDIWLDFKRRFRIRRITEFYGASEGNVAFMNLLNKDRTIGMTANKIALVRYDVDADEIVRDANGRCIEVPQGEAGLLLAEINAGQVFEGYTNAEATQKKVVHDVLATGDAWFNSGDLIREVDVGFSAGQKHYQFVDRVGDTFRWRSENVSTNEVGEILNQNPQVQFCNVYGVAIPKADGRAGMAALTLRSGVTKLDLADFSEYVARSLPSYARPVFLRIHPEMEVTGTFKLMKGDLRREGYDLSLVKDPLYVMKPGKSQYEPLDAQFLDKIRAGAAGF